jgi:long-subunit fatty acid transport protein
MLMTYTAPANGPYSSLSTNNYASLGLFAAAFRLTDNISAGFVFFTPSGGGASFNKTNMGDPSLPPKPFNGDLIFFEFGPAVAIQLPGRVKIGFAYRVNYIKQWGQMYTDSAPTVTYPALDPPVYKTYNDATLSGFGYYGFRIGIQYDPADRLHLGLSYRNPVEIKASGDTSITSPMFSGNVKAETKSYQKYADMIDAGITVELLKNTLFISIDGQLTFYSRYKHSKDTVEINGMTIKSETPVHNKNGYTGLIGMEYMITPSITARLGFNYTNNIFDEKYITPQTGGVPAPSYVYAIGGGYYFSSRLCLNIAASYLFNKGRVHNFSGYNTPGDYSATGPYVSVEIKYISTDND